jgi:hypothetical protein
MFYFLVSATTLHLLFHLPAAIMPPKSRRQQKKNDKETLAPTAEHVHGDPGPSTSTAGSKKASDKQTSARKMDKNTTEPATTRSRSNRGTRVTVEVARPASKATGATSSKTTQDTRQDDNEDILMDDETMRREQVGEEEPDNSEKGNDEDMGTEVDVGEVDAEDVPRKGRPKTEEEKVRIL